MWFKTKDGTVKYPEILSMLHTISHYLIVNTTGYSQDKHNERDHNIELWLKGKMRIFQTVEDLTIAMIKEQRELKEKQKGYVI